MIDRLGQPCNLCIFVLFLFVQEVTEEIKRINFNGFSVTCTFAINERATLKDVRRKTDRELVGNAKAHKIPLQLLDPSLVEYIRHSISPGHLFLLTTVQGQPELPDLHALRLLISASL